MHLSTLQALCLVWIAFPLSSTLSNEGSAPASPQKIQLFDALEEELISIKFIALGSDRANVIIENRSQEILDLDLPAAFGARQVLGQFGQGVGQGNAGVGFGQGQGQGFQQGNGGGQNVGGGFFGGGGNGQGNFGQGNFGQGIGGGNLGGGNLGGGFFRLEPDKKRKLAVQTVCLQYGRDDPNPRMNYEMVPLETVCTNPEVKLLCKALAGKQLDQIAAQAVAWHVANELSWEQLETINRRESKYLGNERFFNLSHLRTAQQFVAQSKGIQSQESTATIDTDGDTVNVDRKVYRFGPSSK